MKKIIFLLCLFVVSILLFSEEIQETEFKNNEIQNINYGINLIKNRMGENKAGQYFKNFGKENIILFLDGFWDIEFLGLTSFEFFGTYAKLNSYQGVFKQKANLSLWLLLNQSFYFETLYKDDYKKSLLAFGYFGKENSNIKHIRAGNSNIKFPLNYGYIDTGGGKFISPGIMGTFAGDNWQVDTMLRYESSEYNSKMYYGNNEIVENKISINAWEKAQHFYIPCTSLYGKNISVLVKDYNGGQWRSLSSDEFSVDAGKKVLSLKKAFPDGVAINYFGFDTSGNTFLNALKIFFTGIPKIHSMIEANIENYKESIFGNDYLILKKKNTFSPFEIASRYKASQIGDGSSINVIDLQTHTESAAHTAMQDSTSHFLGDFQKLKFIQVLNALKPSAFGNPEQMFPFKSSDYKIYIPNNTDENGLHFEILSKNYIPSSNFVLPESTVPGSIRIFKNKIQIFNFEYSEINYTVTINEPILSNDIIEIQWKEGKTYSDSGLVRFASGAHWYPLKGLDLFFAASGDWELTKQKTAPIDNYKISTGLDYKNTSIKTGSVFGFEIEANRKKTLKEQNYSFKNKSYFDYSLTGSLYSKNEIPIFSNPLFHFEENIDINKTTANIYAKANASLDIWKVKLAGSLSIKKNFLSADSNFKLIESYGHSVIIPIYFFIASEDFFVNIYEQILRRECKVNFQKYVDINYLTAVDYNKEDAFQKIYISFSPIIPESDFGIVYTQFNFLVSQKYKTIFNPSSDSYASSWTRSLIDMYSGGEKDAENRNVEIRFLFNYFLPEKNKKKLKVSGINFDAFSKTSFQNKVKLYSVDETGFEISIPFVIDKIFVTPFIQRKITKEKYGVETEKQISYAYDINSLFIGMGRQYWLFSKPFFYDMFDQKINRQIQVDNINLFYSFFNSYGFNVSRLISGSIQDLYIPIEFNTSLSRIVQSTQNNAVPVSIYGLDFLFKYTSLNISGKYGYFDWFKWYDQDELNRLYKFTFSFGSDFFKFKFNSFHSLYFFFSVDNKFGIENTFLCEASKAFSSKFSIDEWKESLSVVFSYVGGMSLPRLIIESFSKIPLSDKREERLSVEFSQNRNMQKLNYKVSFRHSQSTKIGQHGEIKIFAEIEGSSTLRNSFLLNINAGLAGKIDF